MKKENKPIKNVLNNFIHYLELMNKAEDEYEDQLNLDFQKWIESEKALKDMSGDMPYCDSCEFSINKKCVASQMERLDGRLCSKSCKKHIEKIKYENAKNFKFSRLDD